MWRWNTVYIQSVLELPTLVQTAVVGVKIWRNFSVGEQVTENFNYGNFNLKKLIIVETEKYQVKI